MTTQSLLTDAHVHVFTPKKHGLMPSRTYTPGEASAQSLEKHLDRIGADNVVIVQPSPHGTDNRPTLEGIELLGMNRARGIAVIDPEVATRSDLQALWARGIRGLRANLKTAGVNAVADTVDQLETLNAAMKGTDLLLQVFLPISVTVEMKSTFGLLGRTVILDHFGGLKTSRKTLEQDVERLTEILTLPNVVLKASGACRVTDYAETTTTLDPVAPKLFEAASGRVIWGSDWPHTGPATKRQARPLSEIEPFMNIDDQTNLDDIRGWCGNMSVFQEITSDTACQLFGF